MNNAVKKVLIAVILCFTGKFVFSYSEITENSTDFKEQNAVDLMAAENGLKPMNRWVKKNPLFSPSARKWHAMWKSNGEIRLFGGKEAAGRLNDTYKYDGTEWYMFEVSSMPSIRASMEVEENVLFGGINIGLEYFSETWRWDEAAARWEKVDVSTHPSGRFDHSMAASCDKIVFFGGNSESVNFTDDTWIYSLTHSTWSLVKVSTHPSARNCHSFSRISEDSLLLYGGHGVSGILNDTWIYEVNNSSWSKVLPVNSPGFRSRAGMCYDERNNVALLFGGLDKDNNYYNDVWIYNKDLNSWIKQYPDAPDGFPAERIDFEMEYARNIGRAVLFGGTDKSGNLLGDTWEYVIRSSGVYISDIFDAGVIETNLEYGKISWDCKLPPDGEVKFQIASSANISSVNQFAGPDGETDSFYTASGQQIFPGHSNKRYFRYKLIMSRNITGGATDFYVSSVAISYNHIPQAVSHLGLPFSSADNGGLTNDQPVNFYWLNAGDSDNDDLTYEIEIATDADFSYIIYTSSNIAEQETRSWAKKQLNHGGPYFWRVRAFDGAGWGDFSSPWSLYVDTVAPSNITELNAERAGINGAVKLTWTVPDEGRAYRIKYRSDFAINSLTRWETAAGATDFIPQAVVPGEQETYTVTGLADDTTYWFAVRLADEAENYSELSPSPSCKTNTAPVIWLTAQTAGSWGTATEKATSTVIFKYDYSDPDFEDTHSFDILMAAQPGDPYDITVATGITLTEYKWDSRYAENASNYMVKITVKDQRGLEGYVTTGTFRINNFNEPPVVELLSPLGGEYWENVNLISWNYFDPNRTDSVYCQVLVSVDGGKNFTVEDYYVVYSDIPYEWGTGNYPDSKKTVVRIRAIDGKGGVGEAVSGEFEIYNTNNAPYAFELEWPSNNAFVYTLSPQLKWQETADPEGDEVTYTLCISTSYTMRPSNEIENINTNSCLVNLADETIYYWKVIAVDEHLVIRESSIRKFAVDTNPPEITVTWPADGSWLIMSGTETVEIQMNKNPSPYIPLHDYIKISDRYGNYISYDYYLDTATHLLRLRPASEFKPSREYTIAFGAEITDRVGHPYSGRGEKRFVRLIEPEQTADIWMDETRGVEIGKGSLSVPGYILIEEAPENEIISASAIALLNPSVSNESLNQMKITAYDMNKKTVSRFNNEVTLNFVYEEENGFVKGKIIDENYLRIFKIQNDYQSFSSDGAANTGLIYLGGICNTEENKVSAEIGSPGIYSLRAYSKPEEPVSGLLVYPNPFNPDKGDVNIRFNLTESGEIMLEIYTLTGDLVLRKKEYLTGDEWGVQQNMSWNGKNGYGTTAANGMYYCRLMMKDEEKKNFLIGVLR